MHIRIDLAQKARAEAVQTFVKALPRAHWKARVFREELEPSGRLTFRPTVVLQGPQHPQEGSHLMEAIGSGGSTQRDHSVSWNIAPANAPQRSPTREVSEDFAHIEVSIDAMRQRLKRSTRTAQRQGLWVSFGIQVRRIGKPECKDMGCVVHFP